MSTNHLCTVKVSHDHHRTLKTYAAKHDITVLDLVSHLIERWMAIDGITPEPKRESDNLTPPTNQLDLLTDRTNKNRPAPNPEHKRRAHDDLKTEKK